MNLKHLKYFVAIAEAGSLAKAARVLNMSASPLSRRMRELEDAVGLTLFDRNDAMALTEEGQQLLVIARRITGLASEIVSIAGPLHRPKSSIVIGLRSVHPRLRYSLLEAARAVNADVTPLVRPMVPEAQIEALLEGTLDFGTVRSWPEGSDGRLSAIPLLREELGFAVPDRPPFSERMEIGLGDVAGLKLIMHYAPMHALLDDFMARHKPVQVDPYVAGSAAALISQGDHFTMIPIDRDAPARRQIDEPGVLFRRIAKGPHTFTTYLVWQTQRGEGELGNYVAAFKRAYPRPQSI